MKKFMKTKVGFTLVELMVVVLILGTILAIGIPTYRGFAKQNRIKACCVLQRTTTTRVREWCIGYPFNMDYTFTVICSQETGKGVVADANGNPFKARADTSLLADDVLDGDVPYCAAGGTYTIKVKANEESGIPDITVTCNGGHDGNIHKETTEVTSETTTK